MTDTSGGAISGAKLTAADQKTGAEKSTLADAAGQFVFDSLPPGTYTIKAEFPGFTAYEKKDVTAPATLQIALNPSANTTIGGCQRESSIPSKSCHPLLQTLYSGWTRPCRNTPVHIRCAG